MSLAAGEHAARVGARARVRAKVGGKPDYFRMALQKRKKNPGSIDHDAPRSQRGGRRNEEMKTVLSSEHWGFEGVAHLHPNTTPPAHMHKEHQG